MDQVRSNSLSIIPVSGSIPVFRTACDFHYRLDPEIGSLGSIPVISTALLFPYRIDPKSGSILSIPVFGTASAFTKVRKVRVKIHFQLLDAHFKEVISHFLKGQGLKEICISSSHTLSFVTQSPTSCKEGRIARVRRHYKLLDAHKAFSISHLDRLGSRRKEGE